MKGKNRIVNNFIWRFFEKCGAQAVSLVVTIVLARIISPEEYGTIALINVFINLLNVFIDSGLGNAIVQKSEADDIDFSTIFFFNIGVCIVIYFIIYFCAPIISSFYGDSSLSILIRVLGLTVIISALKNVQQAYVMKNFLFKKFFYATIWGTLISGFVGIYLAYQGFGIWALVFQHLLNMAIDTMVLWITVPWRPKCVFSVFRLRSLLGYGYKLLFSSVLNTLYGEMRQLIIGKIYSSSDLAFYNKGKQFPYLIVANVNTSIDSILFPEMSERQNNIKQISHLQRQSIIVSSYVMCPLLIGLVAIADNFISVLLTDKWIQCVAYMRIFCFVCMFYPIQTANLNGIKAVGRSDIFFKLEIVQSTLGITLLLLVIHKGVYWIAIMFLVATILNTIIIGTANYKIFQYGFIKQFRDVLPSIVLSFFMGIIVFSLNYFNINIFVKVGLQVISGILVYLVGSILIQHEGYKYIVNTLKSTIFGKKQKRNKI